MLKFLISLTLVMLFLPLHSNAQYPGWENFTSNEVSAIAEDADYIWTGGSGLLRIDKISGEKTYFNSANSGLQENGITCIAIDKSGTKWIGTENGGISSFDGINWNVYDGSNSLLPYGVVYTIVIDSDDRIWVGTANGLVVIADTNWTVYNRSNSDIPTDGIRAIAIDEDGSKWIGTSGGLTTFDGENWTVYEDITDITCINIDGSGSKWVGTRSGGVYNFDGNKRAVYNSSNSGLPNNEVFCIAFDSDDTKWIGTYGGLSSFSGDPVSVIQYESDSPLQMKISPNPMDQYSIISYSLNHSEQVVISITDMLGNSLARFDLQTQQTGFHSYRIDGAELSSGSYLVTVTLGAVPVSRKVIVRH